MGISIGRVAMLGTAVDVVGEMQFRACTEADCARFESSMEGFTCKLHNAKCVCHGTGSQQCYAVLRCVEKGWDTIEPL